MTLAHAAVAPGELWTSWPLDPAVVAILFLAAAVYARGIARLDAPERRRPVERRQVVAFYGGLASIAVALVSPLDALAGALVSAHMVQHLVLLLVAPPLLVYGRPVIVVGAALPPRRRRWLTGAGRAPAFRLLERAAGSAPIALAAHVVAMWVWHLPGPYQAAVRNDLVHALEHASFLVTALAFWAAVVQPRRRRTVPYGVAIASCFVAWIASGGLGALLSFATHPLYPTLAAHARTWGLTPLQDQQLAGVIMWVPAGVGYVIAMAALFLKWMASLERRMRTLQRTEPSVAEAPR